MACGALGALLAWGMREHGQRAILTARNHDVEDAYVAVLAKRGDLASFLTDPRTRLYRLAGRGLAAGRGVTIAWQDETQSGILIGERIPPPGDSRTYVVWHLDPKLDPVPCGGFHADAAGTFYEFRLPGTGDATAGFLLSVEHDRTARRPGDIAYETR
jgi:hypothetical protein